MGHVLNSIKSKSEKKYSKARKKWATNVSRMEDRVDRLTAALYGKLPEDGDCDLLVSEKINTEAHKAINEIFTAGILADFETVVDDSSLASKKAALLIKLSSAKKTFTGSDLLQNLDDSPVYDESITALGTETLSEIEEVLS